MRTIAGRSPIVLRRSIAAELPVEVACVLVFAIFVAGSGLPVLRHDWMSISDRTNFVTAAIASLAWNPQGIGAPRPYPTDYLLAMANAIVAFLFGTRVAFATYIVGIAALCAWGARRLATLVTSDAWIRSGMVLFGLFNPWVYTKVVAGHIAMVGVYGALLGLVGESLSRKPRPVVAALCMCMIAAEIQFFLLAFVFVLAVAATRRTLLAAVTAIVIALPSIVGVALNFGQVAGIPYTLAWQSSQSMAPLDAANLVGYFALYTQKIAFLTAFATFPIIALALFGAIKGRRLPLALGCVVCGTLAWLWSTGSRGPIAPLYLFAIVHFPALEIFRELYDLLAFVALAYIVLSAMGATASPVLARLSVLPGILLVSAWVSAPPNHFWVMSSELPTPSVAAAANTRVAFLPDVQPLALPDRGSGTDPDAYARPNNVMTLNGGTSVYPAAVALRDYALRGDTTAIAALGVSQVIARPWLVTDSGSISQQLAVGSFSDRAHNLRSAHVSSIPELELVQQFPVVLTPPPLGSAAIYFGDAAGVTGRDVPSSWAGLPASFTVKPPGLELKAANGWVDVRSAYIAQPDIGQGIGGALTTSSTALLSLRSERNALVWIRGRLLSASGDEIARDTQGYRWITIPLRVSDVRCDGECIVVAQSSLLPKEKPTVVAQHGAAVTFQAAVPWLAVGRLEAASHATFLRYAVGFDPHWIAFVDDAIQTHVRLESSMNGWVVTPHATAARLVLIEYVAAFQMLFECLGLVWTGALFVALAIGAVKRAGSTRFAAEAGRLD